MLKAVASHHKLSTVRNKAHGSRRVQINRKLLTGTHMYILQVNGAAFNRFAVNPTCKLCSARPETRQHFIAECVVFKDYRQDYIKKLADSGILSDSCIRQLRDPEFLTQLTLDCSVCVDLKTLDSRKLGLLEQYSREYIHTLHIKRFVTLRQISEN